jgi:apolipoprotein D and lipocalin family protein
MFAERSVMSRKIFILAVVLLAMLPYAREGQAKGDPMKQSKNLIDFRDSDDTQWQVVNDGVMGGVSSSGIQQTGQGTGLFTGELSLENNGGFASVRALVGRQDLSRYDGLEIRVRGDGRTYQLRLRTNDRYDGIAYRIFFPTREDEWVSRQLSFAEFQPTFRGSVVADAPVLDTTTISQVAFMLADKNPGAFSLEIDYVAPYGPVAGDAQSLPTVTTVDFVDLSRYAGLWYEVAKIPNRFQKKCVGNTTAEYTRREDGRIQVVNRCLKSNGDFDEAEGLARIEDPLTNAKLKVSFVSFLGWRPFWGDYWVIGLDEDYRWSIVGTPDRKYGWVLARTPELDEETMAEIFTILEGNGYQRSDFELDPSH